MSKHGTGVSKYTHTRNQLNHYANQHNSNNATYQKNADNHANQRNPNHAEYAQNSGGKKNGI